MTEVPDPKVFENWEEKFKAWKEVQSVYDWLKSDPVLLDIARKVQRHELTIEEGVTAYKASLTKQGTGSVDTK